MIVPSPHGSGLIPYFGFKGTFTVKTSIIVQKLLRLRLLQVNISGVADRLALIRKGYA